jgi:hypothetical protein
MYVCICRSCNGMEAGFAAITCNRKLKASPSLSSTALDTFDGIEKKTQPCETGGS